MTIKNFIFNPFQQNTYILHDESNEAIILDAGCFNHNEREIVKSYIEENKLSIKHLINTHLHLDHQFGNKFVSKTWNVKPTACREDEFLLDNIVKQANMFGIEIDGEPEPIGNYILDNELIHFGNTTLKAIHTPGHSPGSIVYYNEKDGVLFAGDVLFRGSIGRTDLPRGDYSTLIQSITRKLLTLPEDTVVYSGHGPTTTIGYEKTNNPYL